MRNHRPLRTYKTQGFVLQASAIISRARICDVMAFKVRVEESSLWVALTAPVYMLYDPKELIGRYIRVRVRHFVHPIDQIQVWDAYMIGKLL